jgi:hypothetical protein
VLAAEEGRREFDIVSYGGEVLGRLSAAAALLDTKQPQPAAAISSASSAAAAPAAPDADGEPGGGPSVVLDFALVVPTAAEARRDAKGSDGEAGAAAAAPDHPDSDAENDGGDGDDDPAFTSRYEVCRTFLAALQVRTTKRDGGGGGGAVGGHSPPHAIAARCVLSTPHRSLFAPASLPSQLANNGNVEILPGGSSGSDADGGGGGDPASLASSFVGSSSASAAQPAHLAPFRAIFGRGGGAKAKGAAAAAGTGAGGDDGWAFSQAPVYAADDEDGDAAAAAAAASSAGAQSVRSAALAAGFVDPTLAPSFTGAFRLKLLTAVPRADVDGFTAPSAAENVAGGKAPDAGFTGTAADVDPADVAAMLADDDGGAGGEAPRGRGSGSRAKRGDKLSASPPPAAKRAAVGGGGSSGGGLLAAAAAAAAADRADSPAGSGRAAPKGRTKAKATLASALDEGGNEDDVDGGGGGGGGHGKRARLGRA